MRFATYCVAVALVLTPGALCESVPAGDSGATLIATRSIAAITGGRPINEITLTGSAKLPAQGSGTVKLSAFANGTSRMELNSSSGTTTEVREPQGNAARGTWTADGREGKIASHNCWTDAAWFFPALGSLAPSMNTTLTIVGREHRHGQLVYHLHAVNHKAGQSSVLGGRALSAMDFFLDATTFLPAATTFYTHPAENARTNLLVEVEFANYKNVNGVAVPAQIRRYQQGTLVLELDVTAVSVN